MYALVLFFPTQDLADAFVIELSRTTLPGCQIREVGVDLIEGVVEYDVIVSLVPTEVGASPHGIAAEPMAKLFTLVAKHCGVAISFGRTN